MADFQARLDLLLRNPQVATRVEGNTEARRQIETQVLSRMVEVVLLDQAAQDIGVSVDDDEVDARLREEITDQFGSQERYEQLLGQQGLSEQDVRVQVRALMLGERIQQQISKQVSAADIDDAEIQSAYEEQFDGKAPVARHILLKTEEEAEDVKAQLDEGADFAQLALAHSTDRSNASAGGLLGQIVPGQFVAEFEKAVMEARDGEIIGPVKTQFGYHIIQRLSSPPPHSLVDESLRAKLLQEKRADVFQAFVQEQRMKASVKVNPRIGHWDAENGRIVPAQPLGEDVRPASPQG